MKTIPPEVWYTWPIPNYVNPPTTGPAGLIVNFIFMGVAIPLVLLRLYSRSRKTSKWLELDDFFCALGLLFAIGLSVTFLVSVYAYDCRIHVWDGFQSNWAPNLKLAMAAKCLFVTAGACVRQSLLCFYLRLLGDADLRRLKLAVYSATAANIVSCIITDCLMIFMCRPVWAYWTYPSDINGSCIDEGVAVVTCGNVVAFLDLIIVLLPILIVARLQMPFRRKLGVCVLLSLGLIATVAAGLRAYYSWIAFGVTFDISWWATPVYICGIVEIYLAMICSCAPAVRVFLVERAAWILKPFRIIGNFVSSLLSRSQDDYTDGSSTKAENMSHTFCKAPYSQEPSTLDSITSRHYNKYTNHAAKGDELRNLKAYPTSAAYPLDYKNTPTTPMQNSHQIASHDDRNIQIQQPARRGLSNEWAARQEALMLAARRAQAFAETSTEPTSSLQDSVNSPAHQTSAVLLSPESRSTDRPQRDNISARTKHLQALPGSIDSEAATARPVDRTQQLHETFLIDDSVFGTDSDEGSLEDEFRRSDPKKAFGR